MLRQIKYFLIHSCVWSITICTLSCLHTIKNSLWRVISVRSLCGRSSDRSHLVDPLSYISIQPVLHNWCNKGRYMWCAVSGMVYMKDPLLLWSGGNVFLLIISVVLMSNHIPVGVAWFSGTLHSSWTDRLGSTPISDTLRFFSYSYNQHQYDHWK